MTRALVSKECREHGWVVLILWGTCAVALFGLLEPAHSDISPFVAFRSLAVLMGPLLSLAITNRLVVREYGGETQLFLEALPVTRGRVVAIKWLLGAAWTLIPIAAALAATAAWGSDRVFVTARFVALLALRSLSFLLCFYALAFVIGLLGRYRFVAWGTLLFGLFIVETRVQLPMWRLPPLALVSETMAFERLEFPAADLLVTWSVTAFLVIAAFTLALVGEGSVGAMLARRMTRREKVVVGVAALVPVALFGLLDERKPKPPFRLEDAIVVARGSVRVGVARTAGLSDAAARAFVEDIASDLAALKAELGLSPVPPLHLLPDASLDGDVFLRARLPGSDGVVVRGALGSDLFEAEAFRVFVIGEVLRWYTRGRAATEEQRWFFDGFMQWWMAERLPSLEGRLRRRAVAASTRVTVEADALRRWLSTREQLGDCLGEAVAWHAVSTVAREAGAANLRGLARELWGRRPPDDVRVLLAPPFERVLEERTGLSLAEIAEKSAAAIVDDRSRRASDGHAMDPRLPIFESRLVRGRIYEIHHRLEPAGDDARPRTVRYTRLRPWDGDIDTLTLDRVDAIGDGVFPLTVVRGARMFAAIETRAEDLQCTVRLGARRWIVP